MTPTATIHPLRFALQYKPPTLVLEYKKGDAMSRYHYTVDLENVITKDTVRRGVRTDDVKLTIELIVDKSPATGVLERES